MAAGLASRYGSVKQIDPIGPEGETILDYSIYDAMLSGFGKIVFVIRPEMEFDFRETFLSKFENRIQIEFVLQAVNKIPDGIKADPRRHKPWGTAHAILMAADRIHEPFAVINADDFYGVDGYLKMASYLTSAGTTDPSSDEYAMVGYLLRNTLSEYGPVSRGVCEIDENSFLKKITEHTNITSIHGLMAYRDQQDTLAFLSKDTIVSMNFWGFTPSIFPKLSIEFAEFIQKNHDHLNAEFYIPSVVDKLIKTGEAEVKVLTSANQWFGLTYKNDKPDAVQKIKQLIKAERYPSTLWT